jgi:hypothetical protein
MRPISARWPARLGAAALLLTATFAGAQEPAVAGKTPANPLLIVSVPNSSQLWKSLAQSEFGRQLLTTVALPGLGAGDAAQMEKQLGFSLLPSDLFTKTVTGFDLYVVENNSEVGFVANVRFSDEAVPQRILDQMKKDAAHSQGMSGGTSADTVADTTTDGIRQLSLPAFQMHFAADKSVLVWSNQKAALDSAFKNEGQAIFASAFFKRYMDQIADEGGDFWAFGEASKVFPYIDPFLPGTKAGSLETLGTMVVAVKAKAEADHLKIVAFQHQEDMKSAQRRYAMAAPPPGDVSIMNFFPSDSKLAFGTNHFDGLSILETTLESVEGSEGSPITAEQIEQQIQSSRAMLGFDLRNDLIANLGPDLGFAIVPVSGAGEGALPFDITLVTHVKDPDRFNAILGILEESAGDLAAAPPPAAPPKPLAKGEPTPTPTPVPTPAIESEEFQGETIKFIASPSGPAAGIQPGYTFTKDGYFLLALNKETIKAALTSSKGSGGLMDNATVQEGSRLLEQNRNSLFTVDVKGIAALLESNKALLTSTMEPVAQAEFDTFLATLKTLKSITATTIYKNFGKKQELLVLL